MEEPRTSFSLTDGDMACNTSFYDNFWNKGEKDGYNHPLQREFNYRSLASIQDLIGIPLLGASGLDIGCGVADFSSFLRSKGIKRYLGVDIYEPAVEEAHRKYPDEDVRLLDVLRTDLGETFDFAFCHGPLTTGLDSNNYDFARAMFAKMRRLTRYGFVSTFHSGKSYEEGYFYYDEETMADIAVQEAGGWQVLKRYTPIPPVGFEEQIELYVYTTPHNI